MQKSLSIFDYPVCIKKQQNYLVVSVPDLNIFVIEDLPAAKLTPAYLVGLSKAVVKVWMKIQRHLKDCAAAGHKPHAPSSLREVFKKPNEEIGYSPAMFSQMLGGKPSERTIRREIKRGNIKAWVSGAGTARIPHSELVRYSEGMS